MIHIVSEGMLVVVSVGLLCLEGSLEQAYWEWTRGHGLSWLLGLRAFLTGMCISHPAPFPGKQQVVVAIWGVNRWMKYY